jgi:hypothetical protein
MSYRLYLAKPTKSPLANLKVLALVLGLLAGFGFVGAGSGCGASLGTECTLTSDCPTGLYCVFGMCVNECNDTRDCNPLDTDAICVKIGREEVQSDDPMTPSQLNVCQKPKTCGEESDGGLCAEGQTCDEGRCWFSCKNDNDCPGSDKCKYGICIVFKEDAGVDGSVTNEGKPCAINSDCTTNLCGLDGFCKACRATADCFAGASCLEGNCVGLDGFHDPDEPDSSSSSSGWSGGDGIYTTCNECTHINTGAYWHQCITQMEACLEDATCVKLLACSLNGIEQSKAPCSTNIEGGNCTVKCTEEEYPYSSALSKERFYALDSCVYCQTCQSLCTDKNTAVSNPLDAAGYCSVICQQPGSSCQ